MRALRPLCIGIVAAILPSIALAAWPTERMLSAYGTGLLLGSVSVCEKWSEGDKNAATDVFLEWVLRDLSDPQGEQALRQTVARGWQTGAAAVQEGRQECSRWVDDYNRIRTSLELELGEAPPPQEAPLEAPPEEAAPQQE